MVNTHGPGNPNVEISSIEPFISIRNLHKSFNTSGSPINILKGINEKPEYDFIVNTGMYIIKNSVLSLIPEGQVFHITDLIKSLKEKGGKVGVFPISDKSWVDVGQWDEYRRAVKNFELEEII